MPRGRTMISSFGKMLIEAGSTSRADEWWVNKFCPVFGVAYATAYQLDLPLSELWHVLGWLLVSLVAVGSYANLLNDLCDMREDQRCGKRNRLAGRSPLFRAAALVVVGLLGVLSGWALWPDRTLLAIYLALWLVFTLYSLPPIRLKVRGILGVLVDAAGAHLLPQLFGISLIAAWGSSTAPPPAWVAAVAAWSFGRGVRGILWHQLTDYASDKRAGIQTFVHCHSQRFVRLLGERLSFPLELAGLGAMLVLSGTVLAWVFLAVHLLLETARCWRWGVSVIIVMPRPQFRFALDEYYVLFYPLAYLLDSSWRHPPDLLVLAVHVLFFPSPVKYLARDMYGILRVALGPERKKRKAS
jgi:hypothetical protein